jgi:hypothetical protein
MTVATIDELIRQLEDARDDLSGDTEVRVAYQPNWPLRGTLSAVTVPQEDDGGHCDDHICYVAGCYDCSEAAEAAEEGNIPDEVKADEKVLWLAVGSAPYDENPYAPKWAWGSEGWE